ncbi:site-specific integrase [Actinophytocola glycyrrhizae]|uniref:Tyrosine recombinase XerC n=1 Tax=Actinophytocola glycyrrhizae TaxID=2044873 RepID=A0ABV9SAD5_9PSEU
MTVKAWVKALRRSLAEPTVQDVVSLFSTIMNEAVDEGLIAANPCRRLRINTGAGDERPVATPEQVSMIAGRARLMDRVMMIMAAYGGMRWGELAGLQWQRVDLDRGHLSIDAKDGALHEVGATLELGPPKTKASVRTVHLPPFLVDLLAELRASHPGLGMCSRRSRVDGIGGRTSGDGSGCLPSPETPSVAGIRSRPVCTFMICVTRTTRG